MNYQTLNWEKILNPSSLIKWFNPTDAKIKAIGKHLMEGYLNLDDIDRDYNRIYNTIIPYYFYGLSVSWFYELGDFCGILGLSNIVPERKCSVVFKIWDKKIWGADGVRQVKDFLRFIKQEFKLKRMQSESPDERIVRMAKMVGFKVEGTQRYGFKWDDKYYTNNLLVIT